MFRAIPNGSHHIDAVPSLESLSSMFTICTNISCFSAFLHSSSEARKPEARQQERESYKLRWFRRKIKVIIPPHLRQFPPFFFIFDLCSPWMSCASPQLRVLVFRRPQRSPFSPSSCSSPAMASNSLFTNKFCRFLTISSSRFNSSLNVIEISSRNRTALLCFRSFVTKHEVFL